MVKIQLKVFTDNQHETNVPETTLCFIKIDFNIFAVSYTELYKNGVPPIVPLGSCWMPVKKQRTSKHQHLQRV